MRRLAGCAVVMLAVFGPGCQTEPRASSAGSTARAGGGRGGADAQSTFEPRSDAGEGQKLLARMAGEWDVVKTFYPRGGGEPSVTRGTCTQKMIHDGKFLESDFVFHDPGGDSDGMGVIGFDPETGTFTSFWTDSRSTRVSVRQSEGPFDGAKIVLYSKSIGEPGPNARRSRTESTLEDGDRRLVHRQFGVNADGSERPVMRLEMSRTR